MLWTQLIGCRQPTTNAVHQQVAEVVASLSFVSCQIPPTMRCFKTRRLPNWLQRVPSFLIESASLAWINSSPSSLEGTLFKKKNNFPIDLFGPFGLRVKDWRPPLFLCLALHPLAVSLSPQHCGWVLHASFSSWTEFITWPVLCALRIAPVPSSHHQ